MGSLLFEFKKNIFGLDQLGFINLLQQTLETDSCVVRAFIEKDFNQQKPRLEITTLNKSPTLLLNTTITTLIKDLKDVSDNATQ